MKILLFAATLLLSCDLIFGAAAESDTSLILLSGHQRLSVPSGADRADGELKEYSFLNAKSGTASIELPYSVVIPPDVALSNPLTVPGRHEANLQLHWSQSLNVWVVDSFTVEAAGSSSLASTQTLSVAKTIAPLASPNLLANNGGWSTLVEWDDPTGLPSVSFNAGKTTMSVPNSQEFVFTTPNTAPFIVTVPSFSKSFKGDWVLETVIHPGTLTGNGKTEAGIGVRFPDGRAIYCIFEKDTPSGRRILALNIHPYTNNVSIPFNSDECHLRLIRRDKTYFLSYSNDGITWQEGPATYSNLQNPSAAFAMIQTWEGKSIASYTFDYLTLTPTPKKK